ncbi:MAG: glycosyltransferase family 4 protein [Cyanobacteria bacterium J06554_6]
MKSDSRKSVAVWQPYFFGGGAEAVALWILEALRHQYDVTLYTLSEVDLSHLNEMYLTQLSEKDITVRAHLPRPLGKWAYRLMANNKIVRMAFVYWTIRGFKKVAAEYDLVFSAFNGLDMGRPGMQYLHWVHVVEDSYQNAKPWLKAMMQWADFSHERLCQNLSVANSQYTAQRVHQQYGIEADVVFPPVVTEIDVVPWADKENLFLCSGRIVKPKQTHRVISMLKAVREKGFNVKLHITGGGGGIYADSYMRQVETLARQNSDWVYLHRNLSYKDYLELVSRCRYGVHYKPEPFGISVAEMLKADMIPFVRTFGGQMEIVGSEQKSILFADEQDGVEKIVQVLSSPGLQAEILRSLAPKKALFSTEQFISNIQTAVGTYFESTDESTEADASHG